MLDPARRDLLELIGPLHRELRRVERRCADAAGLTMWQYAILSVASRHEGLSQAVISERIGYSKNRIVSDLDVLTARGLAERRPAADRRRHSIHVTADGLKVVASTQQQIWSEEDELLSHMPTETRALLRQLLDEYAGSFTTAP